ncbi:hypothetical protein PPYR_07983 [Photinus pyralis]|uniref:DDE Tnp4 domain-containing protein n=1 Tax=Photinus pyralis TaxID=7054 RepID=A0A5N4AS55_PHOPY|nr:hypothetical protein PPYR_07983 [Photinus pyralis]
MYKIRRKKCIAALCVAVQMNLTEEEKKKRVWVKKWREDRNKFGHMPLLNELRLNFPDDFKNYLRMDPDTFKILLNLISPIISKQNTKLRESISAEERLMATLRYLATGRSFEDLKFSTGISSSALCQIIPETCKALYQVLKKEYMKVSHLHLPDNSETDKNLNFVFLGDEAFSLHENFLKPFPQRDLTYEKRIYNYRLSRARNVSENAFGLLSARFRILHTAIHMTNPQNITYVVLAICALHNFLIKRKTLYATLRSFDQEDVLTHELQQGEWRNVTTQLENLETSLQKNVSVAAKTNREKYMEYFNKEGQVPWQDAMLKKGKS